MVRLNIEEILHRYKVDGGRNFIDTYSVLKERLLKVEYTQTVAEFPGANSHGPDHIIRVLKKLDEILGRNPLTYVNEFELWTAMMAVLYHDVGLLQARDHHAEIGADLMLGERNSYIFDRLERELIQTAIFSHSSHADIRQKCKRYPPKHKIGDFPANAMVICALVRLADELDEDYRRGDEDLFQKREIATKYPDSVKYWRFNQRIRAIYLDPPSTTNRREVQFQVEFRPDDLAFLVEDNGTSIPFTLFAIKKLLKINSERLTCNAFFPEGLRFSHMTLWLVPPEGSSWDPREIPLADQDEAQDVLARFPDDLRQMASGVRDGKTPPPHSVAINNGHVALFAPEPAMPRRPKPTDRAQSLPQVSSDTPVFSVPVVVPSPPETADSKEQKPPAAESEKKKSVMSR
ncbi:HD domain-containing protein [Sorangium sp. So ce381]|uniref:HD domain-containing protein n=1 Tax=Sorangium sp. So ce381 TaxID=3133307 RepID=UPI003F5B2CAE